MRNKLLVATLTGAFVAAALLIITPARIAHAQGVTPGPSSGGSGPTLQTNGTNNASQTLLNLIAGTNITLSNSGGGVTINASGSGGTVNTGSQTVAIGVVADGSCSSAQSMTVTGALVGDALVDVRPSTGTFTTGLQIFSFVSSANTVSWWVCNSSGGAVNLASATYNGGDTH